MNHQHFENEKKKKKKEKKKKNLIEVQLYELFPSNLHYDDSTFQNDQPMNMEPICNEFQIHLDVEKNPIRIDQIMIG
eukprot:CAMPEP_0201563066 /NCGR_PEP_ID=MMETSP0173_2-20130828/79679_1 /ASSEMBLY_ACC=CAM_ASM_000268 /TAXON_ID=218659 /ORGANISM="Vexillifera sp., Strain DIVA3 564/2" /LENGTH=76 /DNA_ID=CAMNT_0047977705 /DNA_START=830 /DNA_END=1060 /DNA_ORIENTATION=+